MNISFNPIYQPIFTSNTRYYYTQDKDVIETYTKLFRSDLEWDRFTDFAIKHFKNKTNVQFIQFAASDGSEAYSQIISLLEHKSGDVDKFFPIEAYEIDTEIYNAAKSGLININSTDNTKLRDMGIDLKKYFSKSDEKLKIDMDDLENIETYKVSESLTNKVNFHRKDMNKILRNLDDRSNTILMCRNIMGYFTERELDLFTTHVACQLKKGSLFVTGSSDNPDTDYQLQRKGFVRIMPCVYMKE